MDKVEKILNKLKKFKNSQSKILTVYLGVALRKSAPSSQVLSILHSQVHQNLQEEERKFFKKDITKIDDYLKTSYDSHGKRSVVFFTAGKNLWEILEFEFYLPSLCVVSYSPYTHPIVEAHAQYKPYLVILADRKKARLFTVHLGAVEEHKDVFDAQVPQKVKRGDDTWDQQNKIQRHIEDHLHRHLKIIAQETHEFVKNYPVSFIIVGGNKDIIPKVKKHLKYPLNRLVLGDFVTELNLPLNEIFLKSKEIASQFG